MAEAVVDRLEMIDVEDQSRHRTPGIGFAFDHPRRRLGKTTAIEHAGQRIHRRCGLVRGHRALRHQHEDHEHRADRVEHEFDGEGRHPDAAAERRIVRVQQVAEQDRQHQGEAMQHRHRDGRPAPLHGAAALAPQFGGGQRRIDRDDRRTDGQAQCRRRRRQRHHRGHPGNGAENQPRQIGLAAVKHARGVPDHAAGQEADGTHRQRKHPAEDRAAEGPERDRRRAEQIGGAPPSQRGDVFLPAEKQQHGAQHRGNQGGHEIKCRSVK